MNYRVVKGRSPQEPRRGRLRRRPPQAAKPEDGTGAAVPMPYCMNAASGARGRRANGTTGAILTRLPTNCGKNKKRDFTMGKNNGKAMGMRKDTGNRPQGAQRCLKMAANRESGIYRGAADYPTCTELNKTSSILFNLTYRLKAPPLCGYRWQHGSRQA